LPAPAGTRRDASFDVSVSSWNRTGIPVSRWNRPAKERTRAANALSFPSGERGTPKTTSSASASRQKRARDSTAAASLRRVRVARGVARVPEASEVARPIRFSPKSTATTTAIVQE
jgi:hypothetical protein